MKDIKAGLSSYCEVTEIELVLERVRHGNSGRPSPNNDGIHVWRCLASDEICDITMDLAS